MLCSTRGPRHVLTHRIFIINNNTYVTCFKALEDRNTVPEFPFVPKIPSLNHYVYKNLPNFALGTVGKLRWF